MQKLSCGIRISLEPIYNGLPEGRGVVLINAGADPGWHRHYFMGSDMTAYNHFEDVCFPKFEKPIEPMLNGMHTAS